MAEPTGKKSRKPRKRIEGEAAKPARAQVVKSTFHLSVEQDQRLNAHCAGTGSNRSEVVGKLINDHLRRFHLVDRGERPSHPPVIMGPGMTPGEAA